MQDITAGSESDVNAVRRAETRSARADAMNEVRKPARELADSELARDALRAEVGASTPGRAEIEAMKKAPPSEPESELELELHVLEPELEGMLSETAKSYSTRRRGRVLPCHAHS